MKANLFVAMLAIGICTSPTAVAQQGPQPQMPVCTPPACQLGVVPPEPAPFIPPGDDIILYIHGGPGSVGAHYSEQIVHGHVGTPFKRVPLTATSTDPGAA